MEEPESKSLITTEEQLFALKPRTRIYLFNSGRNDIEWFDTMGRMPYNTIDIMLFYRGNVTKQLSKHQLTHKIFTDHDEAYRYLVWKLRDEADAIVKHHLKGIE